MALSHQAQRIRSRRARGINAKPDTANHASSASKARRSSVGLRAASARTSAAQAPAPGANVSQIASSVRSATGGIALHAAGVGRGLQLSVLPSDGADATERPRVRYADAMAACAQLGDRLLT